MTGHPRHDARSRRTWTATWALAVAAALAVSGCVLDVRLDADGGGTLKLRYHLDKNATLGTVAERLSSPSVIVRSARLDANGYGTFKMQTADMATLPTTSVFKNVTVQRVPGAKPGTTDWTATLRQPRPIELPDSVLQHYGKDFTVTVTFPGPVLATNATKHDGATATWTLPLREMSSRPETVFSATYGSAG
jgi:hypothetical protein